MSALAAGKKAPAFKLKDLEGRSHSPDLRDRDLALLVFYHRECPVCQFSAPFIARIADTIKSPQIKIWGISQDPEDESEVFANEKGLRMPILVDEPPYPVSNAYEITNVPTLFVIDGKHTIIKNCVGFSKADFSEIARMLADRAGVEPPDLFTGRSDVPALKPG
jgi:peroxiredoxin